MNAGPFYYNDTTVKRFLGFIVLPTSKYDAPARRISLLDTTLKTSLRIFFSRIYKKSIPKLNCVHS